MNEIFKDIVNYEGLYQVSNFGNVKSIKQNIILKTSLCKGYKKVTLCNGVTRRYLMIHRLVSISFIENPENKPSVNHIDGNKLNNNLSNLEWCTNSENHIHAFKLGLRKKSRNILVVNIEYGIFYESLRDAAKSSNFSPSKLCGMLNGKTKNETSLMYCL